MKRLPVLVLAALLMPTAAFADGGKVSLKEAIRLAMERNHLLKAATFDRAAAASDISVSRSRFFPHIRLDESLTSSNSPTRVFMMKLDEGRFSQNDFLIGNLNHPSAHADFLTAFTIEQPLFDYSLGRGLEMSRKEDEARGFAVERRREETAFNVYSAYLEVQKATASLAVTEQAVADAREHERLATVRSAAGTGLKSDELRGRTYLSEMEQQRISAKNGLERARLRLGRATGSKPGEALDISEEVRAPAVAAGNDELARLALQNRQDLKEAETALEKADVGVKAAAGGYLPTLHATASYQMNDRDIPFGRDNDAWMAGVNLRWEIFDGMRRGNEIGKARALRNSAAEYAEDYRSDVLLQVSEQSLRREESAARLEVARHAVRDAEEGVRLIEKRFENSLATMVELLDAQTALNRSRALLIENESDFALATARLLHYAGVFLKEVMK
ncbi:MAG TPA: TolC family protein [Geobacteraceae bacterium]|nr:TolC family protein [Geobacteraceae bacterium]